MADRSKPETPEPDPESQERRRQLRGLLILAGAALAFLLWRAHPSLLFHPNWWRP